MGSQTPAPWEMPSGSTLPKNRPTAPPGSMGVAEQTIPPSAQPAPPPIGAKVLGMWIGGAAAVGLLVSILGAWVLLPDEQAAKPSSSRGSASANPPNRPTAPKSSGESEATASVTSLPSLVERAEQGDPNAIEQIEKRPDTERSVTEALAWARGKSALKQHVMASIAKQLRSDLPLSADRETLGRLRPFTEDPETATEALAILASLRTPMSADMLYDVWVRKREKTDAAHLAKSLLYAPEVRESASDALAVALDLRAATTCEQVKDILPRAQQKGDVRSLHLLGKLNSRYGCGRRGGQDCYACLRGTTAINDAIAEVRRRPAPGI